MIKSIIIIGGGSAGWIVANLLNARLNNNKGLPVRITLVESPDIAKIGVGEATVPSIRRTMHTIGVSERDLIRQTNATFKNLIRFQDWNKGEVYDHPFDRRARPDTDKGILAWLSQNQKSTNENEFAKTFSLLSHISNAGLAPKTFNWPDYQSPFPYAYHLDAIKLAGFLSQYGRNNSINHYLANIKNVKINEQGNITKIEADDLSLSADLFIDCTGFASLLAQKALKVKTRDYSDILKCDRAATMRIDYDVYRPETLKPYTIANAMPSGWCWDIGLNNRRGVGYVYSSQYIDKEEAEKALRNKEGAHSDKLDVTHIKFKTYKIKEPWFGNCVAIGLSAGFLEPLESSGLYLIEFAAELLADLLIFVKKDLKTDFKALAKSFNQQMDLIFNEILEYVNLHYCLSKRNDSQFWRDVTKPDAILPSIKDKLELWKIKPPSDIDFIYPLRLFSLQSYEFLLFGMNYKPRNISNYAGRDYDNKIPDLSEAINRSLEKLPKHEDLISMIN